MDTSWIKRALCIAALPLFLQGCEKSKDPQTYLAQATQEYEEEDYEQSLIHLKSALKMDPSHAQVRRLLADVWFKLGEAKACVEELQKAEDLGINPNHLLLTRARCLLVQNDFDTLLALHYTGNLLKISNQDKAILYALKAQASLKKHQFNQALDYLDQAEETMDDLSEVKWTKALWLAHQNQIEDAMDLIRELTEKEPKDAKIWALKGDLYRLQQKPSHAEMSYSKALLTATNRLDQRDYYLYRALTRVFLNKINEAEEDLQAIQAFKMNHLGVFYVQGLIALSKKDYTTALENFQKVLANHAPFLYGHYFAGLSYALNGNYPLARDHLVKFVRENPNQYLGQKLLALVEIKINERESAKSRLLALTSLNPQDADLYHWLGDLYLTEGQLQQGIDYLKASLKLKPKNVPVSFQVGMAEIQQGDPEAAKWAFDKILEQIPKNRLAMIMKFVTEYQAHHYQLALNIAKTYTKKNPKDPLGFNLEGVVYLAENHLNEATRAFDEALKIEPYDPNAHTQLAFMDLRDGGEESALAHYHKILEKYEHVPTLLRLAKLSLRDPNSQDQAVQYLERAIKQQPRQLFPYLAIARLELTQKNYQKAKKNLQRVPEIYHKTPEYIASLGLVALGENNPAIAKQQWDKIKSKVNTQAYPSIVYELGARLAYLDKDWAQLEKLSLVLQKRNQQGNWVRFYAASLWQQNKHQSALEALGQWLNKHPNDHLSKFWYANYLMEAKEYEKARLAYQSLLEKNSQNPIVYNNMAWILKESDPSKAREYANKAIELRPNWKQAKDTLHEIEQNIS